MNATDDEKLTPNWVGEWKSRPLNLAPIIGSVMGGLSRLEHIRGDDPRYLIPMATCP